MRFYPIRLPVGVDDHVLHAGFQQPVERMVDQRLTARPELDPAAFRAAYAACAVQRHLRIAGQWVRLARRDGRPGYLVHGPRTWGLLQQAVREPVAAPLAAALDRWIPAELRRNPPDLAA